MTIAVDRGWHDGNRPLCVACMNPIGVRGDPSVAVLGGPVLECVWEGGAWLAHFQCRREDWWSSNTTTDPSVRVTMGRTYKVLTDQPRWLEDPQIVHRRGT